MTLPRYSSTDQARDVQEALRALPVVEVKRFDVIASWPVSVRFDTISRPSAVLLGGCWERDDPNGSSAVTGFLWVPTESGVDVTLAGPTADTMQTLTLVAMETR